MWMIAVLTTLIQPFLVFISLLMLLATYHDLVAMRKQYRVFIALVGVCIFFAAFHLQGAVPVFLLMLIILGNWMIFHAGLDEAKIIRWNGFALLWVGVLSLGILGRQIYLSAYMTPMIEYPRIFWIIAASNVMLFILMLFGSVFVLLDDEQEFAKSVWFAVVGVSMMFGFWCGNLMYGEAQQMMCTSLAVIPAWIMLYVQKPIGS